MAAPGVKFVHPARGRPAMFHVLPNRLVQGLGQEFGTVVLEYFGAMLEGCDEGAELTQGIPPQMALLQELLHMPGGRPRRRLSQTSRRL